MHRGVTPHDAGIVDAGEGLGAARGWFLPARFMARAAVRSVYRLAGSGAPPITESARI
jgi:hypothetical protein